MNRTGPNIPLEVSVVIPAYNADRYIARALKSVQAQKRPAREIIVVDDGSTDNTAAVVQRSGSNIRYIHQDNAGAAQARNTGIEAASCDWIAFLDADDEWLEDNLAQQLALLERNPDLVWTTANFIICFCDKQRRREKLDTAASMELLNGRDFFEDYFAAYVAAAAGWTGTMVINRRALQEAGMFQPGLPLAEDLDVWWRIAHRRPRIGYNSEPLAVYHFGVPDSSTARYRDPQIIIDLIDRHLKLADEQGGLGRFKPCAEYILRRWIHECLFDDRTDKIRDMITRFDKLLPSSYTAIMRLLTIWPRATHACMPVLSRINRLLRLPL